MSNKTDGISIIVPAYNEVENLEDSINLILHELKKTVKYEIIIVNDGSTDGTKKIAEKIISNNKNIKLTSHSSNLGFGYAFKTGLKQASYNFITGYPADHDTSIDLLTKLIKYRHDADLIIGVMDRRKNRSWARGLLSGIYIGIMNTLFGIHLSYYNGYFLCKTKLLKQIDLKSEGFTIFAEAKVRLLNNGVSYLEVPCEHTGRSHGNSKAVTIVSIYKAIKNVVVLYFDTYFNAQKIIK